MILHHITIATGHMSTHRIDTLDPDAVAACRALLPTGGPVPGFAAFRVEISGESFVVHRGREAIVWCVVGGPQNSESWRILVQAQSQIIPQSKTPSMPNGRWLAVVLLPGIATQSQGDLGWTGDFERCLAAAMLTPATE